MVPLFSHSFGSDVNKMKLRKKLTLLLWIHGLTCLVFSLNLQNVNISTKSEDHLRNND